MAINRVTRGGPLRKVDGEVLDRAEAAGLGPLDRLVQSEEAAELHRGLERLREIDRATLEAFYLRGQSLKQMSRDFATPVGTIKRRLHVARKRLRRQLAHSRGQELVGV